MIVLPFLLFAQPLASDAEPSKPHHTATCKVRVFPPFCLFLLLLLLILLYYHNQLTLETNKESVRLAELFGGTLQMLPCVLVYLMLYLLASDVATDASDQTSLKFELSCGNMVIVQSAKSSGMVPD